MINNSNLQKETKYCLMNNTLSLFVCSGGPDRIRTGGLLRDRETC